MCGIVGYVGFEQAAPILLQGLSKLEYRGYDSAGIAVRDGENDIKVVKARGRLQALADKTDDGKAVPGCTGIGHTRWATHGEPSETNAHPHITEDANVTGVHNGIIENYQELREKLQRHGYTFYSQTDTEVAIKMIDYYYKKYNLGPVDAITRTMVRVRGSYALAVMFKEYPGQVFAARKESPMVIGLTEGEAFLSSDVSVLLSHTRNVYYVGNMELACMSAGEVHFYNLDGDEVERETTEITWDAAAAEKGGFNHFMMKEIFEQPTAIENTLKSLIPGAKIDFTVQGITDEYLKSIRRIVITACGSAWHVGMSAQYVIERLTRVPVRVELASELRYRNMIFDKDDLVVIISQSGETADSLAALREAKANGIKTLAVVNVLGSTIAREADMVIYTMAGPEIAVATTKAYSTQLVVLYSFAVQMAQARGLIDDAAYAHYIEELQALPEKIEKILENKERIQWFASKFAGAHDIFFIGRGIDYAVSLEGSLKMKEISYIHSEAYAAGELKHGTISLIEPGTLVIGVMTQPDLYEKTLSNMIECKARGAYLMGLTVHGKYEIEDSAEFAFYIPKCDPVFAGSLAVIPLQLMGYYVSVAKGLDVDKPRNLAKSVTVE